MEHPILRQPHLGAGQVAGLGGDKLPEHHVAVQAGEKGKGRDRLLRGQGDALFENAWRGGLVQGALGNGGRVYFCAISP
jgi:hypothetical protein